jgi:UDP-galactopyranose mutase
MWKNVCKTPSMEQKSFEQSNISKIKKKIGLENLNFTNTHKQSPRSKATKEVKKMTKFKDCAIRIQTCIIVDMTSLKKICILNFF